MNLKFVKKNNYNYSTKEQGPPTEKRNLPKDIYLSLFFVIVGTWLFIFMAGNKNIGGYFALLLIGASYLLLGIGVYGILKSIFVKVFKKKITISERLDVIEQRLATIEMMLRITYTPDSFLSDDKVYEKAVESIRSMDKVSTSYLQRRLAIGYARAARILDELEQAGIVGPADGSYPRNVIK